MAVWEVCRRLASWRVEGQTMILTPQPPADAAVDPEAADPS